MSGPTVTVCTIVRGRQTHLANLLEGLARQSRLADQVVVGWMGGADVSAVCDDAPVDVVVVDASSTRSPLPLAHARNTARRHADGNVLVFLDVDVIPARGCVQAYADRVTDVGGVWSGHVSYLPEAAITPGWTQDDLARSARPHATRPRPDRDTRLPRPELFWSLSFACASSTFDRVGGFDESYIGYGAEDTDLALRWHAIGVPLWQTPTAEGFHQHHPTSTPPVQHIDDIVRNARVFRQRWGRWPMEGWLAAFKAEGLVDWDPDGHVLTRSSAA